MTLDEYLNLVTAEHQNKPNYAAVLSLFVQPFVDAQYVLAGLPQAFDLDTAIGVQLDAVGVRIGLSRRIKTPLPTLYFSLDDPIRGLDQGILYNALYGDEYAITLLDDETYRQLLRAKIASNEWDGTIPGIKQIINTMFAGVATFQPSFDAEFDNEFTPNDPLTKIIVQDDSTNGDPNLYFALDDNTAGLDEGTAYDVGDPLNNVPAAELGLSIGISGVLPPLPLLFLLEQQAIPIKPAGVPINIEFTSVSGKPLFGLDVDNSFIGGLDHGALGVNAEYIVNAPPASVYPISAGAA